MSRVDLGLSILFVALLGGIVGGLFALRSAALRQAGSDEVRQSWDAWREETREAAERGAGEGGVARRAAPSPVPPLVILLEDHFAACLIGTVVTTAVPIGVALWLLRGVLARRL